jgi:hypothetical protein
MRDVIVDFFSLFGVLGRFLFKSDEKRVLSER